MSLNDLHRRLVEVARERVRSGEVSERGLARLCGVSQPHMGINILDEPSKIPVLLIHGHRTSHFIEAVSSSRTSKTARSSWSNFAGLMVW